MPIDFLILPEHELVLTKAVGRLTGAELIDQAYATRDHPSYRPTFRQLVDVRAVDPDSEVDGEAIRRLARLRWYAPTARRATVATADIAFGLARMYQLLREEHPSAMQVFRELDEALEYLDLLPARDAVLGALAGMTVEP